MQGDEQSVNTLVVHDRQPVVFHISSASYNLLERDDPHRFELTFHCSTESNPDVQHHPWLEVTIVLESKPPIEIGSGWHNQPGYIERQHLWNVSGYYEWTHENFEDFTVVVRQRSD